MTLAAVVSVSASANLTGSPTLGDAAANLAKQWGASLVDGASAGQANVAYWNTDTLTASSSDSLDLAGSLEDPFGNTLTFARIKALIVTADPDNTNNVLVGGAASDAVTSLFGDATDVAVVRPGATLAWIAGPADATGYTVTAATADLLKIANSGSGTSVTYSVVVIGTAT